MSDPDPAAAAVFRLSGARVTMGGEDVFQSLDLAVEQRSFLAILGENGSGKTTLLRTLLGLVPLTSGSLEIYGTPSSRFRNWERVAYVPQHLLAAGAVPVSVREVVAAGTIGPRTRWHRNRRETAVSDALHAVGLWHRRKDSLDHLSGGQQRRVMIAAALAKGADVLALDEPTAGVDAESVARLVEILHELAARGITIVLVTHELGEMRSLVTRCLVLGRDPGSAVLYDGPAPAPSSLRDPDGHHDPPRDGGTSWSLPT